MQINSRFPVAIHLLGLAGIAAADWGDAPITSEQMATSVNTNPVVVRRVLGDLRAAGLVTSQPGPGGGWRLTRPAERITLRDIYDAVRDGPLFAMPPKEPSRECLVGRGMPSILVACFQEAETALVDRLAMTTIADVIASVKAEWPCVAAETHLAAADARPATRPA